MSEDDIYLSQWSRFVFLSFKWSSFFDIISAIIEEVKRNKLYVDTRSKNLKYLQVRNFFPVESHKRKKIKKSGKGRVSIIFHPKK